MNPPIVTDIEDIENAFRRVAAEIDAVPATDLTALNVDIISASSVVLGVADRLLTYRDDIVSLPGIRPNDVDKLRDYAKATWYIHLTSQPPPNPADAELLLAEATSLRQMLLLWTVPLVGLGVLDAALIARIREGSGNKDLASDLVALVGAYRSKWPEIRGMCGVREADVARAAELGPAVFVLVSRRENVVETSNADATLRLRRAWSLLDRAYSQCRRALAFLRHAEGDADEIAPSLRRNAGTRPRPSTPAAPTTPAGGIGDDSSPFVPEPS